MPTNEVRKIYSVTLKDMYAIYRKKKRLSGVPVKEIISYKIYRKVVEDFLLHICKKLIYENFTFMMPYSLGTLSVKSYKTTKENALIDFNLTKKYGKKIRHLNTHTFGYRFGLVWNKSYTMFTNHAYYSFKHTASRKAEAFGVGKKGLSKHIKALSKDHTKRSFIRK